MVAEEVAGPSIPQRVKPRRSALSPQPAKSGGRPLPLRTQSVKSGRSSVLSPQSVQVRRVSALSPLSTTSKCSEVVSPAASSLIASPQTTLQSAAKSPEASSFTFEEEEGEGNDIASKMSGDLSCAMSSPKCHDERRDDCERGEHNMSPPQQDPLSPMSIVSGDVNESEPLSPTSFVSNGDGASPSKQSLPPLASESDDADNEEGDSDVEDSDHDGGKRKKVAFVEHNPTPISPVAMSPYSNGSSFFSAVSESVVSPREDDNETLTLEDNDDVDEQDSFTDDKAQDGKNKSLLSKAVNRRPTGINVSTPKSGPKPRTTPVNLPSMVDIPDDGSEASLMVFMRYIGCTPVAYGDQAALTRDAPMSTKVGREFVFDSYDDDDNSFISEYTDVYDVMSGESSQGWTIQNEEVGIEFGVDDLDEPLAIMTAKSPPASPVVSPRKKKKGNKLTVDTTRHEKTIKNKKTKAFTSPSSTVASASPVAGIVNVISDTLLNDFLAGKEVFIPKKKDKSSKENNVSTRGSVTSPGSVKSLASIKSPVTSPKSIKKTKNSSRKKITAGPTRLAEMLTKKRENDLVGPGSVKSPASAKSPVSAKSQVSIFPSTRIPIGSPAAPIDEILSDDDLDDILKGKEALVAKTKKASSKNLFVDTKPPENEEVQRDKTVAVSYNNLSPTSEQVARAMARASLYTSPKVATRKYSAKKVATPKSNEKVPAFVPLSTKSNTRVSSKKHVTLPVLPPSKIIGTYINYPANSNGEQDIGELLSALSGALSPRVKQQLLSPRKATVESDNKPLSRTSTRAVIEEVNDSPTGESLPTVTAVLSPKSISLLDNKDGASKQHLDKLVESPIACCDKENSSTIETNADMDVKKSLLAVDTSEKTEVALQASQIVSPSRKSVREVDELLSETRRWLARHNEAQLKKLGKTPAPLSDSTTVSERKVMSNITTKTVLNPKNRSSTSGCAAPTISEQLKQIQAKQRDIESRLNAKEQRTKA